MGTENIAPQSGPDIEELTLNLEGKTTSKPKRKWIIISAIVLVVALLATAAGFIFFGADDETDDKDITIVDIERAAIAKADGNILGSTEPIGCSAELDLSINSMALTMIKTQFPQLEALSDLDGFSLDAVLERNNGMTRIAIAAEKSDEAMPVELLVDSNDGRIYVSSDLSDSYLVFDLATLETDADISETLKSVISVADSADLGSQFYDRFLQLMENADTTSETLTAGGVTQECKVYSATIDTQDLLQLAADILTEFGNNDTKNSVINPLLEKVQTYLEEDTGYINWIVYTDSEDNIIGRNISYGEETLFYYLYTDERENIGFELSAFTVEFSGSAAVEDGLADGSFALCVGGVQYLTLELQEFDIDSFKQGKPNGSIELEPTEALMEQLLGIKLSLPIRLTMEFESTENERNITLSLMEMVTLTSTITTYEPPELSLPEGTEIDGDDTDALNRFLESLNIG